MKWSPAASEAETFETLALFKTSENGTLVTAALPPLIKVTVSVTAVPTVPLAGALLATETSVVALVVTVVEAVAEVGVPVLPLTFTEAVSPNVPAAVGVKTIVIVVAPVARLAMVPLNVFVALL